MHCTRFDVNRFSIIPARAAPEEQPWDDHFEVAIRKGSQKTSEKVGTRSICCTVRRGDESPGKVSCGRSDVGGFSEDKAETFEYKLSMDGLRLRGHNHHHCLSEGPRRALGHRSSVAAFLASTDGPERPDNSHG
jgi:hypothetical protein